MLRSDFFIHDAARSDEARDPASGPIGSHRLAMIRRRMAARRYPINSLAIAAELMARLTPPANGGAIDSVAALLADAIARLDRRAALILQLEFVEQLTPDEIVAIVESDVRTIALLRGAALLTVKAMLDGV